jgi:ech hydrogenase subunit D
MATEIINIEKSALLDEVRTLKNKGYRLVTMSSVNFDERFDLLYHFDRELNMKNLRVSLPKGEPMPSISGIYLAGFLIENEIKDGFGIDFTDLAIDFGGNLMLEDEVQKYPFCSVGVKKSAKAKKEDA